ncbi:c-type cytochrome [Frigidibacter sp. MR17.24]
MPQALWLAVAILAGCSGRQSALAPAGEDAAQLKLLFIVMLSGAAVLWLGLNGLFWYVTRHRPGAMPVARANAVIVGGGVVLPTVLVGALLAWGLSIMPAQRAPGEGLTLRVTAEEWWWRVEYWPEGATAPIVAANEIRLPTGTRTELRLNANRFIHSFWVPALGGKMDMIPGRETVLTLRPDTPGGYRGQCAEFCGPSHALMAFEAVILAPGDFDAWLAAEARPARPPETPEEIRGAEVFRDEGCGACHAIRGTAHAGLVGPDLTHLGARGSVGAGTLPMGAQALQDWIAHAGAIKPGVAMPSYDWIAAADLSALATYLESLK